MADPAPPVTPSTWLEIPESPRAVAPGRWSRLAMRLLLPLALAALLWWIGFTLGAMLVLVAVVVLTTVGVVKPTWSARIEHLMGRFGHWVGRLIAVVLLTIVNLFVFTPVAFVMWLFRYDALAPGVRRDAPSFWHGHTGRSLPKRQFTDERSLFAPVGATHAPRRPVLRVATVVGVVALVLLADLGAGWVYDEVSSETRGTAAVADDTFDPPNEPALRDSPWAAQVLAEQADIPSVADSFLGYRPGDKSSTYTNLVDGVRRSYQSTAPGKRVSVWFFGASALFGDGQRDDHTIPSEFARLAEADGIALEVRNYGRPGTAIWQELQLFEQLVASGQKPDLVVFYDGFNDLAWQMNLVLSAEPTNVYDRSRGQATNAGANALDATVQASGKTSGSSSDGTSLGDVADAYWDQSASHHVYDALHELFVGSDEPAVQFAAGVDQSLPARTPEQIAQAARNAISIQTRAIRLATAVSDSVGAEASFFYQPTVFTKQLLPEERKYLTLEAYEPSRWEPATTQARALLKRTPYVDLGGALDSAATPVFWDFVHTNEEGARLVAAALYSHLLPDLRAAGKASRS
jgi:lysophospholipase L1-like esterase